MYRSERERIQRSSCNPGSNRERQYLNHAKEANMALPDIPMMFMCGNPGFQLSLEEPPSS